jgi:hypothetical protein
VPIPVKRSAAFHACFDGLRPGDDIKPNLPNDLGEKEWAALVAVLGIDGTVKPHWKKHEGLIFAFLKGGAGLLIDQIRFVPELSRGQVEGSKTGSSMQSAITTAWNLITGIAKMVATGCRLCKRYYWRVPLAILVATGNGSAALNATVA